MAEVTVEDRSGGTYTVVVTDGAVKTIHTVRVPAGLAGRLGGAGVPAADLVRASFAFLLEREPSTSILRDFSLEQIGHYFPDYPEKMRKMLATGVGGDAGAV
ncbi:MAG TPA: hypothetical protein VNC61_04030 [Acidimicrobiales bacterium]|nr:hypothetical protein [Acidimicrobiales bacterium]